MGRNDFRLLSISLHEETVFLPCSDSYRRKVSFSSHQNAANNCLLGDDDLVPKFSSGELVYFEMDPTGQLNDCLTPESLSYSPMVSTLDMLRPCACRTTIPPLSLINLETFQLCVCRTRHRMLGM